MIENPNNQQPTPPDVQLYGSEMHAKFMMARKTLPVRKTAEKMSRVAVGLAFLSTLIYITGLAPQNVQVASWVLSLTLVGAAAGFDSLRRRLLELS